jgi:hypothetical protein
MTGFLFGYPASITHSLIPATQFAFYRLPGRFQPNWVAGFAELGGRFVPNCLAALGQNTQKKRQRTGSG